MSKFIPRISEPIEPGSIREVFTFLALTVFLFYNKHDGN